jgi:hypothetical protein
MICKLIKILIKMAKQLINVGSAYDDPDSDHGRRAMIKCNENFTEIYDALAGVTKVVIEIGAWNMNGDATKDVAYTIPAGKVMLSSEVTIYRDTSGGVYKLDFVDPSAAFSGGFYYDGTDFKLYVISTMTFDSANFDSTLINRGNIIVELIDEEES